jgi:hypothetical protein
MENRLRVFESEGAKDLAKRHVDVSRLKWHGERQQWITEFQYTGDVETARECALQYVKEVYSADNCTFWKRKGHEQERTFYIAFDFAKELDLKGYYIVTP